MPDNTFIRAERIVRTALGLLEREIVLPNLVWRDAAGDFAGAKDDTISIRLPSYAVARSRTLRGGTGVTMDELTERKVDVTLTDDIYKAVPVTDEELTLDIEDFGFQVLGPVVRAVARKIEETLATTVSGATYEFDLALDESDPYLGIVQARKRLNDANVPKSGRSLIIGSSVEAALLSSERLSRFDQSGSSTALRDASIGMIAGFTAVQVPELDPETAYAFHSTAYILSTRAPVVPDGATFGASESFAGLSMRTIRDYDFVNVRDRLLADTFVGSNVVTDNGAIDDDGKFVPSEDPDESGADDLFVRSVKLTLAS